MLRYQIHHLCENIIQSYGSSIIHFPSSLGILGVRSQCFKKHPKKEGSKFWKSRLPFLPGQTVNPDGKMNVFSIRQYESSIYDLL